MWAFMTTGTEDFLLKLMEGHPTINYYMMRGQTNTLVYYENKKKKSIFASGRRFEVMFKKSEIWRLGFIAMEHIPVDKQTVPLFESNFEANYNSLHHLGNLLSARLLRDRKKGQYIFMTQWRSAKDYEHWRKDEEKKQSFFANMIHLPAYFAHRPFTNTYIIEEKE